MDSSDIAHQFGIPPGSVIAQRAIYTMQKNRVVHDTSASVEELITTLPARKEPGAESTGVN